MPETATPILGDVELRSAQRIATGEHRALVEHRVPGMAGSVFQDMGRRATRVELSGLLFGDQARANLERLRQAFHDGEPLPFTADITTATEIVDVLIARLHLVEVAGRPLTFAYRLELRENPPAPSPIDPLAGVDADVASGAQNLLDQALAVTDVVSTLEDLPDFGDPTPPLNSLLDDFAASTGDLPDLLDSLTSVLGQPAASPATGIFAQLPDLGPLEALRDLAETGFQGALDRVPLTPADILGSLPADLDALLGSIPGDPGSFTEDLHGAFEEVQGALAIDPSEAVRAVADGIAGIFDQVVASPLGELVFAAGESRDLKDILLEQVPALTDQFLAALTEMRDGVVSAERVQMVIDFVDAIDAFTADLPDDPAQLADFLARSFLGLPDDLLSGLLDQVDPLFDLLQQMAEAAAGGAARQLAQTLIAELQTAVDLVAAIDPAVESGFQAAIDQVAAAEATLGSLAAAIQSAAGSLGTGLDGLDLPRFEIDFRSALENLPAIDVTSLEELKAAILGPLLEINQRLADGGPEAVVDALRAQLQALAERLGEADLEAWQEAILSFFDDLKEAVEALDLAAVRDQVAAVFDRVNQTITELGTDFKDTLVETLETQLTTVEGALAAIDVSAVETFVEDLFDRLDAALDGISIEDLRAGMVSALGSVDGAVGELVTLTATIAEQLEEIVSSIGEIELDAVTSVVIAEIEDLTAKLRQIDPDSLSTAQKLVLTAAVAVLEAVDFQVAISDALVERYDDVAGLTAGPLATVTERLDELFAAVTVFDPETLITPLSELYSQIAEPIDSFQATTLIEPLETLLAQAKAACDLLSPEQLRAPLAALYTPLVEALAALSPADLLQPVSDGFSQFEDSLRKVDLRALFTELETLLEDLLAAARSQLVDHVQDLGLPPPITDFLLALTPVLDLMSPAFFSDPVNKLIEVLDAALDGFKPGDLFAPLQALYDRLLALVDQLAEEVLTGAFEQVRETLVDAVERVDPAVLDGAVAGRLDEIRASCAALDPGGLASALQAPYQTLAGGFDDVDPATVPPELEEIYEQLRERVVAADPAPALDALQTGFDAVKTRLDELAGVELAEMASDFAVFHDRIEALIPDFLRQPVTAESLTAGLEALRPDAVGAEIDAAFGDFRAQITALRPQWVAELEGFAGDHQDALDLLSLQALGERFQTCYEAILDQLTALDPALVIAEIQGTFDTVEAQVAELDPVFLVDALNVAFGQLKDKLDDLGLETLETRLDQTLADVQAKVALLDPVGILRDAGLLETFEELQAALSVVSAATVLAALDEALQALRAELVTELGKTQTAFEGMIGAIPTVDVGLGGSIGF